jgi:hypothetical protein
MQQAPRQKAPQISPIFVSERVTPQVSREKDGKLRFVYADGTMRRSFSRTAAGSSQGVVGVDPTPWQGGAMTPPQKLRPPLRPPLVVPALGASPVHRTVHFSPALLGPRYT